MPPPAARSSLPAYKDLIYPTLRAVERLGGSAQAREITAQVVEDLGASDAELAITYDNREKSVLVDRLDWARSYATLGGALERPSRGLFVLTPFGRQILAMPEQDGKASVLAMDRKVRSTRRKTSPKRIDSQAADVLSEEAEPPPWREALLRRLHALTPDAFEEFVIYLLKAYGMELTRVGGSGDEGVDGIGLAPISEVLSSRVAIQVKRHDPGAPIGRSLVALFQRDASTKGAERAVFVTLSYFSPAARQAAVSATPTVTLIDGDRLCDLVERREIGIRSVVEVDEAWFDLFEKA